MAKVAGVGLVVTVWITLLKGRTPEFSLALLVAFTALALGTIVGPLREVVETFGRLNRAAGGSAMYIEVILKSVAIAYVAGFAAQLSRDAGQQSVAMTVETVGKVAVLASALPVFVALLDALWRLLPAVG
ncbi:MAG: stage III sporulation protein AD [Limnochordaceae bacterium]|uniref:SpoIIIAC/SpoIIIAD family protein n=1 Tax=Carboxydichorda subterranea TaxID=3109565 RepID=A0ABZ1C0Q3_9FIRM|nr:SpoIIIAC/SpoIIIAD family protein [Limnochorda sp. L945t]MBE3598155.1 stage III sporulation protein AD [Limnochordaceae bacterium]WRP18321.1 SpoIIIAC/SpoIIIAD family protein [Limnochorda sp. L945t]